MSNLSVKGVFLAVGAFMAAVALLGSANASSLRHGSAGGADVTGALPGQVQWTYYETTEDYTVCGTTTADLDGCDVGGFGDNIIRLINPVGAANKNLQDASTHTVCAMIYVFDDDEEMGECCGCPLTSAQLATFSVEYNLTSNWGLRGGPEAGDHGNGAIAIVAAGKNAPTSSIPGFTNGKGCASTQSGACNKGCDPTNTPGYEVTTSNNLLGTITHNQIVHRGPLGGDVVPITGLTEIGLSDDAGGDPTNLIYLQNQCGALVGNGTGGGICNCPVE